MADLTYVDGDTVHISVLGEVVWQDENAVCVAVPGVDEPFIAPLRTDDGAELRAVLLEPALTDVRPGDVYQARMSGLLWLAVNIAADALADREVRFVSAVDGRICDPGAVLREHGPLRRVVALDQGSDRPVMFHLPEPHQPRPPLEVGTRSEDLADPLPATVPVDPALALSPLPDDTYVPPPTPVLPPLLPSASTAPGEIDDATAVGSPMSAVILDRDQATLTIRTEGLDGVMTYLVPFVPGEATQIDRAEVWASILRDNGWERTGGWRRTPQDDGYRAPVRPAKRPEPPAGDPATSGEVAA
jgi:hypothetical protein